MEKELNLDEVVALCKNDVEGNNTEFSSAKKPEGQKEHNSYFYDCWAIQKNPPFVYFRGATGIQCNQNLYTIGINQFVKAVPIGHCSSGQQMFRIYYHD